MKDEDPNKEENIFDGTFAEKYLKEVINPITKVKSMKRDILTELRRNIMMSNKRYKYDKLNQETSPESKKRLEQQRANKFKFRGCALEIGSMTPDGKNVSVDSPIFHTSFDEAVANGDIQWQRTHTTLFNSFINWSDKNPLTVGTNKTRAIYLCGPTGVGKSYAMKLLAIKIFNNENDYNQNQPNLIKYVTAASLIKTYMTSSADEKIAFERDLAHCKYLFIDDLGAHHGTDWNQTMLHDWLGRRLNQLWCNWDSDIKGAKPIPNSKVWTFFSSNYTIQDLGFPPEINRRIIESAVEYKVGPTKRPQAPKNQTSANLDLNPTFS